MTNEQGAITCHFKQSHVCLTAHLPPYVANEALVQTVVTPAYFRTDRQMVDRRDDIQ